MIAEFQFFVDLFWRFFAVAVFSYCVIYIASHWKNFLHLS